MAKRKSKKTLQDDAAAVLLESPVQQKLVKKTGSLSSVAALFFVFLAGVSVLGWFCLQQQQNLDELCDTVAAIDKRISNFRQVTQLADGQANTDSDVEDRIIALEEAQKHAQQKADVALATSEELKNTNLYSQLLALHAEMDARWDEIKQAALSVTTLQATFKNHTDEFEAVRESALATWSSSSALAADVAGLSGAVATARARLDEQVELVEALNTRLDGQASDLHELKASLHLHHIALHTNGEEMAALKELLETKQSMRVKALEEMLSSVQTTLDEQFFTSKSLHSSVMAQLHSFHSQLASGSPWPVNLKSDTEGPAAAPASTPGAAEATQEELEHVEEEEEEEEEVEEEVVEVEAQEEEQLPQEIEEDFTEEEEEIAGQSEEVEDAGEAAEEEEVEEEAAEMAEGDDEDEAEDEDER